MSARYLISKNGKIIGLESSMADVEAAIGRDFRVKKQDLYAVHDLMQDKEVCVLALVAALSDAARPRKTFQYPSSQAKSLPTRNVPQEKPGKVPMFPPGHDSQAAVKTKPRQGCQDIIADGCSILPGQLATGIPAPLSKRAIDSDSKKHIGSATISSERYMILKNDKIIGYENSFDDVEAAIARNFRIKKQDVFQVQDLEQGEQVCVLELVDALRDVARPKFKLPTATGFSARKDSKPIRRTPLKRSTKPIPQQREQPRIGKSDIIDDDYSDWLGQKPCVLTGAIAERGVGPQNIHCHHIRGRRPRNDYQQVPLMGFVHSWGELSYHELGKTRFLEKWQEKLKGVECIIEYFEDHARLLKAQYDMEVKEKK